MRKDKVPHPCPVCGKTIFPDRDSFEICEKCGWEDDDLQLADPNEELGPNYMSLNEYREKYQNGWRPEWLIELEKEL